MIARLFGVPPEKKETETTSKLKYDAVTRFSKKNKIIEKSGTLTRRLKPESILNEKRLIATQKASESYYPTRGVVTVGILMSLVGLLLFSPIKLPSIYRFVGGTGFFIMGISVIGSGLLNSRKSREAKTE
jgi:hypothetical protein